CTLLERIVIDVIPSIPTMNRLIQLVKSPKILHSRSADLDLKIFAPVTFCRCSIANEGIVSTGAAASPAFGLSPRLVRHTANCITYAFLESG
ncbi:hypothetical protein, partial [uncultured Dubosiella sp.]|uniref:hypothetical protein n=1 Tax=uncultured Dubosiella sp. TaxID=1937011 RepID=UPI0026100D05